MNLWLNEIDYHNLYRVITVSSYMLHDHWSHSFFIPTSWKVVSQLLKCLYLPTNKDNNCTSNGFRKYK